MNENRPGYGNNVAEYGKNTVKGRTVSTTHRVTAAGMSGRRDSLPPVEGGSMMGEDYGSGLLEQQGRLPPRRRPKSAEGGAGQAWGDQVC